MWFMKIRLLLVLVGLLCSVVPAAAAEKKIYGLNENVLIVDFGLTIPAKLDTGAVTASLDAHDIRLFKKNGKDMVRFRLTLQGAPDGLIELPVVRTSRIKRRAGDYDPGEEGQDEKYTSRPVVMMTVCLGQQFQAIEVNLVDRSHFSFPLLLGSRALTGFNAIVDPAEKYLAKKPGCKLNQPASIKEQ